MIKVAVSQSIDHIEEREETRDTLDQRVSQFLTAVNCLTIPAPNFCANTQLLLWLDHIKPEAILLSGGNDLGDFPKRDLVENYMLHELTVTAAEVLSD